MALDLLSDPVTLEFYPYFLEIYSIPWQFGFLELESELEEFDIEHFLEVMTKP
jgi:hypothetical protein